MSSQPSSQVTVGPDFTYEIIKHAAASSWTEFDVYIVVAEFDAAGNQIRSYSVNPSAREVNDNSAVFHYSITVDEKCATIHVTPKFHVRYCHGNSCEWFDHPLAAGFDIAPPNRSFGLRLEFLRPSTG